jgi:DNA modification methylase
MHEPRDPAQAGTTRPIADRFEIWDIGRLVSPARNARTHSDSQIAEIAASIVAFKFVVPVVVDSGGVVIAGTGRLLAAQRLKLAKVPVIVADHLTESEKRAYAIADNKIALNAGWDDALLRVELEKLTAEGIELGTLGFTQSELDALIDELDAEVRRADEDAVPEAASDVVSRTGDIWRFGEHTLLSGDAIEAGSFVSLLGGQPADMVFTDPPYNVAYVGPGTGATIQNDDQGADFGAFLENACKNLLQCVRGALYICMSSSELHTLHAAFTKTGGHWSTFIIWGKSTFTLGRSDYHRQYEPILYGWQQGEAHYWCGARNQADLWYFDKPHANDLHPTMKPVALVEQAIRNSSRRGEIVLDPFAGSGSTLIACEKTGRRARLMEIDPHYCDVIIRRWQDFTGGEAVLEPSGSTFNKVSATRVTDGESHTDVPCEQTN